MNPQMTDDADVDATLALNGINGTTGEYLLPDVAVADIADRARGETHDKAHDDDLRQRHEAAAASFGMELGWDPQQLEQAGWGVIFASDTAPEVIEALEPLLAHRRQQAGDRFRQYVGAQGYRQGDFARDWLARAPRNKAPGPADPRRVPYYLLLVGDPEDISFRFQYELDVNYAVGRIHFDSLAEYAQYANSVLRAENEPRPQGPRRAAFFGVRNRGDRATQLSADRLVAPLALTLGAAASDAWVVDTLLADQATKAQLCSTLLGIDCPSLLFTASHGMGFSNGDPLQLSDQGALLCQDWPGPLLHRGPIPPDYYFSAQDLPKNTNLAGLIAFHFACYGAGTPKFDDYAHRSNQRAQIAPRAFLSDLSKRELGLAGGGALAVVGHVERAWTYSFSWPGAGDDLTVFESALDQVMAGGRLGAAMNAFGQKHADIAVSLNGILEDERFGAARNDPLLAGLWTANNDSRSYVIIGDPAVRLKPLA
jgi:hypothetical protein